MWYICPVEYYSAVKKISYKIYRLVPLSEMLFLGIEGNSHKDPQLGNLDKLDFEKLSSRLSVLNKLL